MSVQSRQNSNKYICEKSRMLGTAPPAGANWLFLRQRGKAGGHQPAVTPSSPKPQVLSLPGAELDISFCSHVRSVSTTGGVPGVQVPTGPPRAHPQGRRQLCLALWSGRFGASVLTDMPCWGAQHNRCPRRALAHLQVMLHIDRCRLPFATSTI